MDVGERIKARRKELGMSAEQVAAKLGVSPATVYRYESHEIMNMRIDKLEPIAMALHTTPEYLMGWSTSEKTEKHTVKDDVLSDEDLKLFKSLSPKNREHILEHMRFLAEQERRESDE